MKTIFIGGGIFIAFIAFAVFLHLRFTKYNKRVNAIIDESIKRQCEKESDGFSKMPDRHRLAAIEQRSVRVLLQRRMKLPDDLDARIKLRVR